MDLQICDHDVINNPDECGLRDSLQHLLQRHIDYCPFIILTPVSTAGESEVYIQVLCKPLHLESREYEFVLEYRAGSEDKHFQYRPPNGLDGLKEVTEAFVSYLHCEESWKTRYEWKKLPVEDRAGIDIG